MFEEFEVKKVFQINRVGGRPIHMTIESEERANEIVAGANKNTAYMKGLREKLFKDYDCDKVMEEFDKKGSRALPKPFYEYFQLCYIRYHSLNRPYSYPQFFDIDFEKDLIWMDYEGCWVPGTKDEEGEFEWLDCITACYVCSSKEFYDERIGDDPMHRTVGTPENYNYDQFKEALKSFQVIKKEGKEDYHEFDRIECHLTFEGHDILFVEVD